jgi:hypothetical protein
MENQTVVDRKLPPTPKDVHVLEPVPGPWAYVTLHDKKEFAHLIILSIFR